MSTFSTGAPHIYSISLVCHQLARKFVPTEHFSNSNLIKYIGYAPTGYPKLKQI